MPDRAWRQFAVIVALSISVPSGTAALADAQVVGAGIQGTIRDNQGGVLPGATVTAPPLDRSVVRDDDR